MKKLYLFDIDGTLLSPGPAARKALNEAIAKVTGNPPDLQIQDVAGLTDPIIIRNVLRKEGHNEDITDKVEEILAIYLETFRKAYAKSSEPFLYTDAMKLLERVEKSGNASALLTGNVRTGAEIKLGRFDLLARFAFGVFGDDGEARTDLPWVARERAWGVLEEFFRFDEMVIVGDTPNDARVAREYGCESIIVCRREEWRTEIQDLSPTYLVNSLNEERILIKDGWKTV